MRIMDFLEEINNKLKSGAKDNEFSMWVEDTLCDNFKQFRKENEQLALEMNDILPDITEQMEPGMESDKFHAELSAEVERLIALIES